MVPRRQTAGFVADGSAGVWQYHVYGCPGLYIRLSELLLELSSMINYTTYSVLSTLSFLCSIIFDRQASLDSNIRGRGFKGAQPIGWILDLQVPEN